MKKCNCDDCVGYHEGYCVMDTLIEGFNPNCCGCKSNDKLITEDEFGYLNRERGDKDE